MNGGFGMKKDLTRVSKPQECSLCKRIFLTPHDLISHTKAVHLNRHFSTFSSAPAPAPATLRHYPNFNRNPSPAFQARTRFDLNCNRSGHINDQRSFHRGSPVIPPARNTNVLFGQQEKTKLMNLIPAMPSEGLRTLPLICQLEQRTPQDTATEKGGDISSSVDLTLRL